MYCIKQRTVILLLIAITMSWYGALMTHLLSSRHYDASTFIHVGLHFARNTQVPENIKIIRLHSGYDGQFYYRLARDPFFMQMNIGPRLDSPAYRQQRILYPLLVWGLSLGHEAWIPWLMIAVNLFFAGLLAALAGYLAIHLGRSPWWGLMLSLYPGFYYAISFDLPETISITFLVACLLALRQHRPRLATLLLTLGILTKEPLVVSAAALLASWLYQHAFTTRLQTSLTFTKQPKLPWYCGIIPIITYLLWQLVLCYRAHGFYLTHSLQHHLKWPFQGLIQVLPSMLSFNLDRVLDLTSIMVLILLAIIALSRVLRHGILYEQLAFLGYCGLLLSANANVWSIRVACLRIFAEFYVFALVLLATLPFSKIPMNLHKMSNSTDYPLIDRQCFLGTSSP